MEALVIVPTYNERDNIETLIERVLAQDPGISMLIVDANSPDGTGTYVSELSQINDRVHGLYRPAKMGQASSQGARS